MKPEVTENRDLSSGSDDSKILGSESEYEYDTYSQYESDNSDSNNQLAQAADLQSRTKYLRQTQAFT